MQIQGMQSEARRQNRRLAPGCSQVREAKSLSEYFTNADASRSPNLASP